MIRIVMMIISKISTKPGYGQIMVIATQMKKTACLANDEKGLDGSLARLFWNKSRQVDA